MSKHTHSFQAEVSQLLHLVTHSLYSNKEIFLRELVSNASDACDKLRYEALNNAALFEGQSELEVRVSFDKEAKTITIADNGIGMSQQEAIDHLGTIAKSGTREFMGKLSGDQKTDAKDQGALIGQFGVGFYSGYIVADRITVESRRAGLKAEEGVRWSSAGTGEFDVETITQADRGTKIILHLRDDSDEYLSAWKLKSVINKYSDHISLPIRMRKEVWKEGEKDQPGEMVVTDEWETVNQANALWARPKKDVSDEQYQEFYKHISHDFEPPLTWSHNRVEGSTEYTQLLYIPSKAPMDLFNRDKQAGLKLYVKRVFIMDDAEALMPTYLRFIKGVVDSADLPLNVSRELLQESRDVKAIREGNTRRVLSVLEDLAKHDVPDDDASEDDKKDAGDIGAGHTVTALYEIVPVGESSGDGKVDALKYQKTENTVQSPKADNNSNELLTLKIRYKKPDGDVSTKEEFPLTQQNTSFENTSESFRFSSAVALFGMLLRKSDYVQDGTYKKVLEVARKSKGEDKSQYRQEFIELVKKVEGMKENHNLVYED